jgi:hypothetical protein
MLIVISVGSAVATAVGLGLKSYQGLQKSRHRQRLRREHLLIQGLHQAGAERPVANRRLVSTRQSEMETLLLHVRAAADALVAALAVETELGQTFDAAGAQDESLFEQWKLSRRAAEQAQQVYSQAVEEYQEFVQSLAPPLRAKAFERGGSAMALART